MCSLLCDGEKCVKDCVTILIIKMSNAVFSFRRKDSGKSFFTCWEVVNQTKLHPHYRPCTHCLCMKLHMRVRVMKESMKEVETIMKMKDSV